MKKILVVVDMQKDFVDGALGSAEAVKILGNVVEKIKGFDGEIVVTYDTHTENYLETTEGKNLPVVHCVKGTEGWQLDKAVEEALSGKNPLRIEKPTFGATELAHIISESFGNDISIELIGLCTDICVISNAMLLKAAFYEAPIAVDASCCAGVTPESHINALKAMEMCQITVTNK